MKFASIDNILVLVSVVMFATVMWWGVKILAS
jgi:hypothetical protein